MKAVILAAGRGSRLNANIPKNLIPFANGKCILEHQLSALRSVLDIEHVYIVVGYKKEMIMEAAPKCTFVYNDKFASTNTAKSLAIALERIDDDVLWINGDVYAETAVFQATATVSENIILVNKFTVAHEEVAYSTDLDGNIVKLAKGILNAQGEALGINKVCRSTVPALTSLLKEVTDADYFERAIEIGIERGIFSFRAFEMPEYYVKEMDFPVDFEAIQDYLRKEDAR